MKQKPLKILISGGGTGGHIFPAIAIADALKEKAPNTEFLFIGAKGRMEMEKIPAAGYPIKGLWISGFQRSLSIKNLSFPFKLIHSLYKAGQIIKQFKPDVVIGVGGYASGPCLRMAIRKGKKTLIQEQNSYPGITNRLVGKQVDKICVAFHDMDKWFPKEKIVYTGNPLRKSAVNIENKKDEAATFFEVDINKPVILIVGGSQGALAINQAIANNLEKLKETNIQLVWQTGTNFLPQAQEVIKAAGMEKQLKATAFINRMDLAYAIADIVIARAGAMTISELSVVQKPVIFVPLPTAAEDHQTKNAQRLVDKQAALLIENSKADKELIAAAIKLANNRAIQVELTKNIGHFAKYNAAEEIAEEVLKLAER